MNRNRGNVAILILLGIVLISGVAGYFWWQSKQTPNSKTPLTWDECAKNPQAKVQLTYPETCTPLDGRSITRPTKMMNDQQASSSGEITKWKTLSGDRGNLSYSFQYPPKWGAFEYSYCKTTPNPKGRSLSAGCIEMLVISEDLPSEDTFNTARDVVLTSEIQTKVSGFNAKRRVYELAESTLEGPKLIPGESPILYELWIYDSNNTPFFLLFVNIGDGTDLKTATEFVGDLDQLATTLKILKKTKFL